MIVQVIGIGYVGLATSLLLTCEGIVVNGFDKDATVVEMINCGEYWYKGEDIVVALKDAVHSGMLTVSNKIVGGDVYIIAVSTKFSHEFGPDMREVLNAVQNIMPILKKNDLIVVESTIPCGYLKRIEEVIFESRNDLIGYIDIVYCPERLGVGDSLRDIKRNNRVVGGNSDNSIRRGVEFYEMIISGDILGVASDVAEISKLTESSLRDVQIAFANQISMICAEKDVDVWSVLKCVNTHSELNMLSPSAGVGGGCIPVNPNYLIYDFPYNTDLLKISREIDKKKTDYCLNCIVDKIEKFEHEYSRNPVVAFMGLSYKPNVGDIRNSSAMAIVDKIARYNICDMILVEPYVDGFVGHTYDSIVLAIKESDIVVYLVAHKDFRYVYDYAGKILIDFVGVTGKRDRRSQNANRPASPVPRCPE